MEICEPHDSFTPSKAIVDRMVREGLKGDIEVDGRKYGLVLDIGGYHKNVVTLAPSLHITRHEMDLSLQAARPRPVSRQQRVRRLVQPGIRVAMSRLARLEPAIAGCRVSTVRVSLSR